MNWLYRTIKKLGVNLDSLYEIGHPGREEGRSPQWPRVRAEHLKVSPVCLWCLTRQDLDVHHLIPFHLKPALELDHSNLRTLCRKCHFVQGHFLDWRHYNPDFDTDLAQYHTRALTAPKAVILHYSTGL